MGEMLLMHFKDDLPLAIIRPTIVSSTYKDPFPGWIEGLRYYLLRIIKKQ
jgi:fatty acyl-CoA reductase